MAKVSTNARSLSTFQQIVSKLTDFTSEVFLQVTLEDRSHVYNIFLSEAKTHAVSSWHLVGNLGLLMIRFFHNSNQLSPVAMTTEADREIRGT